MLFEVCVEHTVGHAGLYAGDKVFGTYLEDLVHRARIQADATLHRNHVPFEAAPLAKWDDGDALFVGEAQNLCDLFTTFRENDGVGAIGGVMAKAVRVTFEFLLLGRDAVLREDAPQLRDEAYDAIQSRRG